MALIKMGSIVTRISGKVGGQSFGNSASGFTLKNIGQRSKTNTASQSLIMERTQALATSWRSLTNAQREAYASAAPNFPRINRLGDSVQRSGYNLFMWQNLNLLSLDESTTDVAPTTVSFDENLFIAVSTGAGTATLSFTPAVTGFTYLIFCSRPLSTGVTSSYKNQFIVYAHEGNDTSPVIDLATAVESRFGAYAGGSKYFVRIDVLQASSGVRLSNWASTSFISV